MAKKGITYENSGGRLTVQHTERQMRCFNVTEPELESLAMLNVVSSAALAFGGAVLGFCIDFKKDVIFAEKLNPQAEALQFTVNWMGMPLAIILFAVAAVAWHKKGMIVDKIKRESTSGDAL